MQNPREPIFNIPAAIVVAIVVLTAIHSVRLFLSPTDDLWTVFTFGFVPARYDAASPYFEQVPGGAGAGVWSFLTYSLLHGSWIHLGVNVAWMVAFGTPVLRRLGTVRFLALSATAAVAGAALHLSTHWGAIAPMIGASAAISGQMGAATRFAFQRRVMFGLSDPEDDSRWKRPAMSLVAAFRDVRIIAFVGIWFAVNYLFGATSIMPGVSAAIAWQAHVGGFLVGLLLFSLFDIPKSQMVMERPVPPFDPRMFFTPAGPDNAGYDDSGPADPADDDGPGRKPGHDQNSGSS